MCIYKRRSINLFCEHVELVTNLASRLTFSSNALQESET